MIPYLFSSFTAELFLLPSINNGYSDFLLSLAEDVFVVYIALGRVGVLL